jgi:hypothetical protein
MFPQFSENGRRLKANVLARHLVPAHILYLMAPLTNAYSSSCPNPCLKKVVTNRVAPQAHIAAVKNYPVREAELDTKPPVETTFLDDIAGRFGQMFKVN